MQHNARMGRCILIVDSLCFVPGQKLVYLVSYMGCKYAGPFIHLARQLIEDNVSEGACLFENPAN